MNCFTCERKCPMQTEKYMDVTTPCFVCKRAKDIPTDECKRCIKYENECYFAERDKNEKAVQGV